MSNDPLDRELDRLRSPTESEPPFPATDLWEAIRPAVVARGRRQHRVRVIGTATLFTAAFLAGWTARASRTWPDAASSGHQEMSMPLAIQHSGAEFIAQLAAARSAMEPGSTDAGDAYRARGVAVAVLTGAAAEVARMSPASEPLREIVHLGEQTRAVLDTAKATSAR